MLLHSIGIKLRTLISDPAFRLPDPIPNKPFESLTSKDQGLATFALLTTTGNGLDLLRKSSPEIADLIKEFQTLVPVVDPSKIQLLITTPEAQTKTLEQAYAQFESGKVSATQLAVVTKVITGRSLTDVQEIRDYIQGRSNTTPTAPQWVFYGAGSESKAYQDGFGIVYKVAPVNQAMLDIPRINDGGPLYPRIGAHLFANSLNQIPILERILASTTLPGLAPTEIVALTKNGDVVFKQVDFGNVEPTANELHDWATRHGHVPLQTQGEDPQKQFDNDTSVLPVVVRNNGRFHLILDLNPRNSRRVKTADGKISIVPFDIISRPLLPDEIEANPQIKAATLSLMENTAKNERFVKSKAILDAARIDLDRLKAKGVENAPVSKNNPSGNTDAIEAKDTIAGLDVKEIAAPPFRSPSP